MLDERPDEFFSWRSRLSPPDALPEQGLDDRDLTWDRLAHRLAKAPGQDPARRPAAWPRLIRHNSRLRSAHPPAAWPRLIHPRVSRRRLTGYRIAAACLLLILIPAARLFHDRSTRPITAHLSQPSAPQPLPSAPRLIPSAPRPSVPPPFTLRSTDASPVLRSGPNPAELARLQSIHARLQSINNKPRPAHAANHPAHAASDPHSARIAPAGSQDNPSPAVLASASPVPDSSRTPQQNTLIVKQLRVVHINELDNPNRPEPSMTSIHSREPDLRIWILLKNH